MKFYAKNYKLFSLWKAFGDTRYIARFFTIGGMQDKSFVNDDTFLNAIKNTVVNDDSVFNLSLNESQREMFDIIKVILDADDGASITPVIEKYPNSKLVKYIKNDRLEITLRLKKHTKTVSYDLYDSFLPSNLICLIILLK